MRRFILPAVTAAAVGLMFLPSHAQASWLSEAIHQARGDYDNPGYVATPNYPVYPPGYVATPDYPAYAPGYYDNAPPVTYSYQPSYYVAPNAYPYGYGGVWTYGYGPRYYDGGHGHEGWHGHDGGHGHDDHGSRGHGHHR